MPLEPRLTIRDPVHGNIDLTAVEMSIIDLPIFQRLRGLKQSSLANYTYPTALTTRFEHSLGATHIAGKIVEHLFRRKTSERDNLLTILAAAYNKSLTTSEDHDTWRDAVVQGVRLGALYHDLGHLPFSHCFEEEIQGHIAAPPHSDNWGKTYAEMFREFTMAHNEQEHGQLRLHEFLSFLIASQHPSIDTVIKYHKAQDAHSIALDIIMPFHAAKRNSVLETTLVRIVRGEIDCDRMDYIRRDAGMAGSGLGRFDTDRLIQSLVLHQSGGQIEVWPSIRGMSALEAFFLARLSVYRWQYHHHNVVYFDRLLRLIVRDMLTGDLGQRCPEIKIVQDISASAFLAELPQETSLGMTQPRDDAYLWSVLNHAHKALRDEFRSMAKTPESVVVERNLVMLEELLFRWKRHKALWKDQIGFVEFRKLLHEAFEKYVMDNSDGQGVDAGDRIGDFLTFKDIQPAESQIERLAGMILGLISDDKTLGQLQEWLWKTERGAWLLVDYRDLTAFRRLRKSSLSSVLVRGRAVEGGQLHEMTKVSDVLAGLSSKPFQRIRFFAYMLDRYNLGVAPMLDLSAGRAELARLVVEWLFSSASLIDQESRRILRLKV